MIIPINKLATLFTICLRGSLNREMVQHELRPRLERLLLGQQGRKRQKATVGDVHFSTSHPGMLQLEQMHNTEVDLADLGRVVVEEADAFALIGGLDDDLLTQLASSPRQVGVLPPLNVARVDMPADTDRALRMESGLGRPRSSGVVKELI